MGCPGLGREHLQEDQEVHLEPHTGTGMAAALMEAADFYFLLANPKFAVHLSGKLPQEGSLSSRLLGASQGGRAGRAWRPLLSLRPFLCTPGLCHPSFINSRHL